MSLAVEFDRYGGPEVMHFVEGATPSPAADEITIRHAAIGLNYIDVYHRTGLYPIALPGRLGMEAAGVVTACGGAVRHLAVGDRVAYAAPPLGAYATERTMPAAEVLRIPDEVPAEVAAALLLKGMTAYYLLHLTYPVQAGDRLLIHAAAGGVGMALVPWAKALGATVIGTVGSAEKAARARSAGCDHVVLYRDEDFVAATRRLTEGRGVDVVYDSVGRDTFAGSLAVLRRRGMLVSYGNASGKPPPLDVIQLSTQGSLYLTRPTLGHYTTTRAELERAADAVFSALAAGILQATIGQRYAFGDVVRAHVDLEARRSIGPSVLLP